MSPGPMPELVAVGGGDGGFQALARVFLDVCFGKAVPVIGLNGAGETTLMRVIPGPPLSGRSG